MPAVGDGVAIGTIWTRKWAIKLQTEANPNYTERKWTKKNEKITKSKKTVVFIAHYRTVSYAF